MLAFVRFVLVVVDEPGYKSCKTLFQDCAGEDGVDDEHGADDDAAPALDDGDDDEKFLEGGPVFCVPSGWASGFRWLGYGYQVSLCVFCKLGEWSMREEYFLDPH